MNAGNAITGGASQACASGVIMRPDGYILTNSHAVDAGSSIIVALQDQRKFPAKIVGKDPFTDLAILKIDANSLAVPAFADSTKLRRGDWVIAIGDPLGLERAVSSGVISGLHRSLDELNNHVELIQTDAAINVGNLGGPLINLDGQVVGINAISKKFAQNVAFAIPIDVARDVSDKIIATGGSLPRPYLGIFMQDISALTAAHLGLPEKDSVIVRDAVMNGPGQRAGLMRNDLIRKVDGVEVNSVKAVRAIVGDRQPGAAITFTVVRNKEEEDRKVLVGTYPTGS
jgi:serine protease Do